MNALARHATHADREIAANAFDFAKLVKFVLA